MRVLLAHNSIRMTGGAEFFFLEVGRVLEENGHEVAYFSVAQDDVESRFKAHFPEAHEFRSHGLAKNVLSFPRMVYSREAKTGFAKVLAEFRPDVVHVFAIYVQLTPSILDAAREAGVPVVMSCNDYKHICPNYKLYHHGHVCTDCRGFRFYNAVRNRCAHDSLPISVASSLEAYVHHWMDVYRKNVRCFLFASRFMAEMTEKFWEGKDFEWQILRNPFDPSKYRANVAPGEYALYFGRIIDEKGVDVLVEAAALCPEIPVVIVGDGPDYEPLRAAVAERGLDNVSFTGAKWGEELEEIVTRASFVVVPSLWHENFPYVILQAFAHGKGVIGARRGGITELVSHGERGLVYEATDAGELAQGMQRLYGDTDLQQQFGRAARTFVEAEFGDPPFYRRLMEIYEGLER